MTSRLTRFVLAAGIAFGLSVLLLWPFTVLAQSADPGIAPPSIGDILQQVISVIGTFRTGAVIAALIGVVNILTNLTKVQWLADRIPSKARPWIALALGVLTAAFTARQSGATWIAAIIAGVMAGLGSIGLHELVGSFQSKPGEEVGKVVAAAAAGDAAATAKVASLSSSLDDIQALPVDQRAAALADWARTHPPQAGLP